MNNKISMLVSALLGGLAVNREMKAPLRSGAKIGTYRKGGNRATKGKRHSSQRVRANRRSAKQKARR